ncbi:heme-degrading domain-containing protein [Cryobacterium melibiosiphilum]|uniref:Heme-degrading domain-containing protein n=1 Tax=Cryobacterium melibiosiphilum TaxID=995039 RepID=A0A3A5MTH3_9MICO|nr:heme-degrading domain-containing protein [Cryobacterium melibiosiphilum]RJT90448.1 heme-degrading domain-containing protein [Cryobacterium melibiosiphilum]
MSDMSGPHDESLHEQILREEAELVFVSFTREDAWVLGAQLRAAAHARSLPLVIGITLGRLCVFQTALPGASRDNEVWLERKTRAALHFERSSMGVGEQFRELGRNFEAESRLSPESYAANGGVFPIRLIDSGVIGAVGVSGLPQLEDHAFVVEQLRLYREQVGVAH